MQAIRSRIAWLRDAVTSPGVGGVLARGSLGSFGVRATATVLLFGMHVLLARVLGVASYGNYVYAITWVQLLALFSAAGMDSASARYVAQYRAKGEGALLAGFLSHARFVALALSLVVVVLLLGVMQILAPRLDPELVETFRWGAALLPVLTLLEVRSGALRGFKRVVLARVPVEVLRPVLVAVGALTILLLARDTLDAPLVMMLSVAAAIVGLMTVDLALRRQRGWQDARQRAVALPRREWSGVGFQLLLVAGFFLILGQTDTLMLGALRSTRDAGIYAVGVRLAAFVSFALVAVNVMIGPQIAELHAAERHRELQRVLTMGARASLGFALLVVLALMLWGEVVLRVFGEEFVEVWTALLILMTGHVINCIAGLVGTLMIMTGRQALVALVLGVGACVNLLLNALLIPHLGMLGAAAATTVTVVLWNAALVCVSVVTIGVDPTPIGRRASA